MTNAVAIHHRPEELAANAYTPTAPQSARLGELIRLQVYLDAPDLTPDAIRAHVADRIENLLPIDYHVYRRQRMPAPAAAEPGPLLGYLEWQLLVAELEEMVLLAEMLDEAPEGARWVELRSVLLVSEDAK